MHHLKKKSNSAEDKEGHFLNAYRIIKFQFSVTNLHEISHIFFTYLGEGLDHTPPSPAPQSGESGWRLEELIFGGRLHFLRDKRLKDTDCGVCRSTIGSVQGQLFGVTDV